MLVSSQRDYISFRQRGLGIMLGNIAIEMVDKFKYLGVIIDRQLKFKEHANNLIKIISYKINYLYRCSHYLTRWTRTILFNTLILPHFNYCSTILFLLNQNELYRFKKLQNRAMRIILCCSKRTAINSMLKELQWLSVENYFLYQTLIFIFKIKTGTAPSYLRDQVNYNFNMHTYNTRTRNDFYVRPVLKRQTQTSVFFKGLNSFNQLPPEIKSLNSLTGFRTALRKYLLRNAQ